MTRREMVREKAMEDWLRAEDPDRYPEPGPVTAERTPKWWEWVLNISFGAFLFIAFGIVAVFTRLFYMFEGPLLLLIFVPMLAILGYYVVSFLLYARVHLLETGIHLDEDRFRSMHRERVLREVPLDKGTEVEVIFTDGWPPESFDDVQGYVFKRGWWGESSVMTPDYPERVVRAIWPNLKAAVGRHGLRTGKHATRLMEAEVSRGQEKKRSPKVWPTELLLHQEQSR